MINILLVLLIHLSCQDATVVPTPPDPSEEVMTLDEFAPIRALSIALPPADEATHFTSFVERDLAVGGFNTLILRIDWMFNYKEYPVLRDYGYWSQAQIDALVEVCNKKNIVLVPHINLYGHQSWESRPLKLLNVFPEFDETPNIKLPEVYHYPNSDGLYCKSYCPNHPRVHDVIFSCVDELIKAFKATNFHAGLDEVFYVAHKDCHRCKGKNPAEVYANEVTKIHDHLAKQNVQMWMWGDRLIDANEWTLNEWEASKNNTYPAVDIIPKDIIVCDWHYIDALGTTNMLAQKGFDVLTCSWNNSQVTQKHLDMVKGLRSKESDNGNNRVRGYMQTVWEPFSEFTKGMQSDAESSGKNYMYVKRYFKKYTK